MSAAEQQLYLQFIQRLGITEENKTAFLSPLLRNLSDASSKLDMHLASYGATVYSAVSRQVVPENPRDAPCYRSIRVVDRIGYFSGSDAHTVRLGNIGMFYAFRFLAADALAVANAALLDKNRAPNERAARAETQSKSTPGGTVIKAAGT